MWTAEAGLTRDSTGPAETGADPTDISRREVDSMDRVGPRRASAGTWLTPRPGALTGTAQATADAVGIRAPLGTLHYRRADPKDRVPAMRSASRG